MKRRLFLAFAATSAAWPASSAADGAGIVVIVHKNVPVVRLERTELRPIFQVTRTEWPNNERIVPFNLPENHPLRRQFDRVVLGLEPDRVASYWIDRKIRGGTRPPKNLPSTAFLAKAVAKTDGAIGYVAESEVDASVRVVARIKDGKVIAP
jgi:ABC-type phosphate transport system substrate-binding protein